MPEHNRLGYQVNNRSKPKNNAYQFMSISWPLISGTYKHLLKCSDSDEQNQAESAYEVHMQLRELL